MATNADNTTLQSTLRIAYGDIQELVYKDFPFLGLLKKNEKMTGRFTSYPIQYTDIPTASPNFLSASNNTTPPSVAEFQVGYAKMYNPARIDRLGWKTSQGGGAAKPMYQIQMESAIRGASQAWERALLNPGGTVGRIVASGDTQTFTLTNKQDSYKIQRGMVLNFASSTAGGTLRGGGSSTTVFSVDPSTGNVSGSAYLTAAGAVANDFVVPAGVYNNSIKGVGDYLPASAPVPGESFNNWDRSVAPEPLGGVRIDGTGGALDDVFVDSAHELAARGGRPDLIVMGWKKIGELKRTLATSQWSMTNLKGPVGISYRAVEIQGPFGPLHIVGSWAQPDETAYMLTSDSWELGSVDGPIVQVVDDDVEALRLNDQDAYEIRVGGYGNLFCYEPGYNARITLPKSQ